MTWVHNIGQIQLQLDDDILMWIACFKIYLFILKEDVDPT